MNRGQRKALCGYVRWVADAIGLRDWSFRVTYEDAIDPLIGRSSAAAHDPGLSVSGRCLPTPHQKHAVITFRNDFPELSRNDQRELVVHELIHCHFAALQNLPRLTLWQVLPKKAYDIFYDAFYQQLEWCVDGCAKAIAPSLPYVRWDQ